MKKIKNYINGNWVSTTGKEKKVLNPATGEVIGIFNDSTIEETRQAITAAKNSFYINREWRDLCPTKRSNMLLALADQISTRRDEIAVNESINNGKPLREAECDIDDAVQCFRYYAGLISKPHGQVYNVNKEFGNMHTYSVKEPIGICALITPWNYPFLMAAWKIAPALAAGNSIIFKPSSLTPMTSVLLFEMMDELNFPCGSVNLVLGSGNTAGQELAESKDIDMISFTGSTPVGQSISRAAADNLKKVGLELGGKSPNIVFDDAELEAAVEWAMIGIFFNQGEVCSAGSRLLIQESIKDKFITRLVERAEKMVLGNPADNPDMGPLISEEHMNKVLGYIESGKREGATCLCGGERFIEGDCEKGYFIRPTIFDNCKADMKIVKEEIFGPVLTVQSFTTEEEAIEMANDTIYGLAGAVFTTDVTRALRVIGEIRAGITWVNCYNPTFSEAPWGGYKMSGIGRELGIEGFSEYLETKQININVSNKSLDWYAEH